MLIHHYGIIQSIFTALKILLDLPIHTHPQLIATTELFTVSIVWPFLDCHIIEIIQYVTFPNWLLSLNNMHSRFLHVFS